MYKSPDHGAGLDGLSYYLRCTGSVRLVVNLASGEVVQRTDYDEFGRVLNDTNPGWVRLFSVG